MLARLFGWLRSSERDIRQLNRDAEAVVKMVFEGYSAATARAVAKVTRETLEEARIRALADAGAAGRVLYDIRGRHKEARRRNDQIALSALTLVIIYLRAKAHGDPGRPARQTIDHFLDQWEHAADQPE